VEIIIPSAIGPESEQIKEKWLAQLPEKIQANPASFLESQFVTTHLEKG
jgi:hypothetical protein